MVTQISSFKTKKELALRTKMNDQQSFIIIGFGIQLSHNISFFLDL